LSPLDALSHNQCAFGDPWLPENTGFSLAKTRGTVSAFDIL
jgi:hypothetical protein